MSADVKGQSDRLEEMLQKQIIDRGITDARVIDAMRHVPRELFFPGQRERDAYADRATPIECGQTISQPYVVALMTASLDVTGESTVLEIGTGSGYQAAVLGRLAKDVCTIERHKPLLDVAFERIMDLGLRNVRFHWGDGHAGWPGGRQFDRVMLTAAPERMPTDLLMNSLVDGGVAVLPVGESDTQYLLRVERRGNELIESRLCPVRFVPMLPEKA
ncbi:MAG: protein-L-isoaspartate(D-aspartate) O-methyltransferase [Tepidisphaeraceae bacterium]